MLPFELNVLTGEILGQIHQNYPEGRFVEYKRELKIDTPKESEEFLKDISSFANANGGDVFYGIDEKDGVVGIGVKNPDDIRLKMQQKIEDGIFPRIPFRIHHVEIKPGIFVYIVRVLKGYNGPHGIKAIDQYFYRSESGKRRMDFFQLRHAFLQNQDLKHEIERFVNQNISDVRLGNVPVNLGPDPKVCMFIVPINYWYDDLFLTLKQLNSKQEYFEVMEHEGGIIERNFDGFIRMHHHSGYIQLFRNGTILSVSSSITLNTQPKPACIPTTVFQDAIHLGFMKGLNLLKTLSIQPPIMSSLLLIGAQDAHFPPQRNQHFLSNKPLGKEVLKFPVVYLDEYPYRLVPYTRKWFDFLWQGFGYESCLDISKDEELSGMNGKIYF